jgi:predicted RNA binding protein YcfA (HicA-like mRNA interferase family)
MLIMADYKRKLIKLIEDAGYEFASRDGRHEKFKHSETGRSLAIPRLVEDKNLARRVLKQAGVEPGKINYG